MKQMKHNTFIQHFANLFLTITTFTEMFWTCSSWTAIVLQLVIWEYCGEYDSKLHCFWVCLCIYTTKLQNTIVFVFTGQKVKKDREYTFLKYQTFPDSNLTFPSPSPSPDLS